MQSHERVQDQEPWREFDDGAFEAITVGGQIKSQCRCCDDVNVEVTQADAGGGADAFQATAHDVQGVLSGVQQDASGLRHGESAQARRPRRHRNGQIQGEKGFAAFRFAADDADGIGRP